MARIIGGIGSSHTPTIGFALDSGKQNDSAWSPIFEAYAPLRNWLSERQPDVAFMIYNDHVTSFFFDHYSAFALGIGESFEVADEGGGPRALPPIAGHPKLAKHLAEQLMADEFDMSFFQRRPLDHGCFSPMSLLADSGDGWPLQMIPLAVGVLQNPVPSARRCYKLGHALRRAIESFPEDLKVVIIATGGLSHQVHGERSGFNNPAWDEEFLKLIVDDPESLAGMSQAELALRGGWESSEVVMWLIMRGALSAQVKNLSQSYYLPSMTGIATLLLENAARPVRQEERDAGLTKVALSPPNSHPFDLTASVNGYELNRYLHAMVNPEHRARFLSDEEGSLGDSDLTAREKDLIRKRDWHGLINAGAIFFGLEKLAAVLGLPNAAVYAAMRRESLEDFQRSRNAPGALYSVGSKLKS